MPICPSCKYLWKNQAKVCPNNNARGSSKRLGNRYAKYKKNLIIYLNTILPMTKFSTTKIIQHFGLTNHTEGDAYRLICDGFVCRGVLTKVRFSTKGHIYMKNENVDPCSHSFMGENKDGKEKPGCLFDWKLAKEVDVDEVD